jgi:hypothetical protein
MPEKAAPKIDFHIHTTCSDGTLTPVKIVQEARRLGLSGIAICDHDTVEGIAPAREAAAGSNLLVVPGIELNTDYRGQEVHILGYGFDSEGEVLQNALRRMREGRGNRNLAILSRLEDLGKAVSLEMVKEIAAGEIIARPHIAEALVRSGHVASKQEAFDRFLAKGASAFVERYSLTPLEACRVIAQSGGLAVLAHPGKIDFEAMISQLLPAGLRGLEVYHPDNNPKQRRRLLALAQQFNLLVTGGTDSHGPGSGRQLEMGSVVIPEKAIRDFIGVLGESYQLPEKS